MNQKATVSMHTIFALVFTIVLLTAATLVILNEYQSHTWTNKTKIGTIKNYELYYSFPNEGLLITFTDGDFILVTKNYMGVYAILLTFPDNVQVKIDYRENGHHKIHVEEVEAIE